MDVHTPRSGSAGGAGSAGRADPDAPDRTDPYSYRPYGNVDTGAGHPRPSDATEPSPSPREAFASVTSKFSEIAEYANLYVTAKTDAFKATMRNVAVFAALGIVGLIALGALVVTSVVMLCLGIAQGIGRLLWGHMWAGYLITSLLLLGLLAGGVIFGLKMIGKASKKALVKKYELRQRDQRERFGHDAADRAVAEGKVDV